MRSAVLLFLMLAASTAAAAQEIQWHGFESGMARSRFEKKKAVLYFRADWCPYCAEMEQKTLRDPAVVEALNRHFIAIRIDSDREKETAQMFRVKSLPDLWFMSETGEVIGHRPGYIPPPQMLKILNAVNATGKMQ